MKSEKKYEVVFGKTFALYNKDELIKFIEPFKIRFERNNFNAKEMFYGKKCFDAGCGGGRGTLFMLMNGAGHVTSYDYSEININTTTKNVSDFGFDNITARQGSLEEIPYADESFDFVWCNGVIMHTANPDKCLSEIARILKVGGSAWIYVYGSGGVYWYTINRFRKMLGNIDTEKCISALQLLRYETGYVAEYIDDWFAVYLRTYTKQDFNNRLEELGFENPSPLKYGTDYDTSHRINMVLKEEINYMGEGDLRYLIKKIETKSGEAFPISSDEQGSEYEFSAEVIGRLKSILDTLEQSTSDNDLLKIMAAAHIQRELRILLSMPQKFVIDKYIEVISNVIRLVNDTKTLSNEMIPTSKKCVE